MTDELEMAAVETEIEAAQQIQASSTEGKQPRRYVVEVHVYDDYHAPTELPPTEPYSSKSVSTRLDEIEKQLQQVLALLEGSSQSGQQGQENAFTSAGNNDEDDDGAWRKEFEAERAQLLKDVPPESSLHKILGIARTRKVVPMTKEEDREAILGYLTEKYLR